MLNNFQFNQSVFNEVVNFAATAPQDDIVYNGYWLQNENIIVSNINYDNWHSVLSETYSSPLSDLGWELNYYFKEKVIMLRWYIKEDTATLLNQRIDILKQVLGQNNQDLDIKVEGTIRRAKANCINLESLFERQNYNITFLPFNIRFRLIEEFASEITLNSQSFTWKTATFTEEVVNLWTVRTNPLLTILLNTATTVTSIAFALWDNTITVLDTYSWSDVIQIDCENKLVTINSASVDYTWTFPELSVWVNSYTITIDWTKNFNTTLSYYNNYL